MAEHGLSEDEVADLMESFSMFDVDGGGTLRKQRMQLVRAIAIGRIFWVLSSTQENYLCSSRLVGDVKVYLLYSSTKGRKRIALGLCFPLYSSRLSLSAYSHVGSSSRLSACPSRISTLDASIVAAPNEAYPCSLIYVLHLLLCLLGISSLTTWNSCTCARREHLNRWASGGNEISGSEPIGRRPCAYDPICGR